MSIDVDGIIAEAAANEAATQAKASPEANPANTATPDPKAAENEAQELAAKPDSELTPEQLERREANRQSHLNSKLAKMRRENRALKEALAGNQPSPATQPVKAQPNATDGRPVKPKEEDFDGKTWGEYQEALDKFHEDLTDWKVEQKLNAKDTKQAEANQAKQLDGKVVERINAVAEQEAEFAKQNPEYATLYEQNAEFMNSLPLPIAHALMSADNASLALYALMKEGKLEDLEDMEPLQIFREIAKAEVRGAGYLKQGAGAAPQPNAATNAPRPLKPAKGNATPEKSLNDKSVDELMEQFGKRTT